MGVRLYPKTEDRRELEILAGVPEGTAARLDEVVLSSGGDMTAKYYKTVHNDPVLDALHCLKLHGYGKFTCPEAVDFDKGETKIPFEMSLLIGANDLPVDNGIQWKILLKEGMYWN